MTRGEKVEINKYTKNRYGITRLNLFVEFIDGSICQGYQKYEYT